ncbi:hypothetical protein Cgig2_019118 [Carnegiea gigantea]|uniref:DUF4283 domain-containing protein n=1 Tax=Carnegiea gigantea TaxID=171969 RepID=A0A9Q1GU00_9CARY|nr:hypothetical protein Cgig2_019118 [Carnegiea gigantea]
MAVQETRQAGVLTIESNRIDEPTNTQVHSASSYASLVDPEEGINLKFLSTKFLYGKKIAKINIEDVEADIEYWQNAVICSVLRANPPYKIIQGFVKHIRGAFEIDKILQVRKGFFLIRFGNLQDKLAVKKRGIYYFDAKPFLVMGWNPQMDLQNENIKSLPIWVHLPELDIKFWGSDSLSKIGSILGIPLKTDKYTRDKVMIKYARLLIDIPLHGHFPDHIEFFNEDGVLVIKRNAAKQPLHIADQSTPESGNPFLALDLSGNQIMHCCVTQVFTNKKFYITFVYEMNHDQQRQPMWEDLKALSQHMTKAWCILGNFNAVLYKEDRRGSNVIHDTKLRETADFMEYGES